MSRLSEKARFKETVSKLLAKFNSPIHEQSFVGAEPGPILEHVTRRHFIDPFLRALGWDLTQLNEEMIEEARTKGETTLRLDYLGVNNQTRIPVLIVEAKAWTAPFVSPSANNGIAECSEVSRPISLICAALEHCKAGGHPKDSPVTHEWANYLAKLHQYVATVRDESGHIVTRVAILSGQWLVIFNDPKAIFLEPGKVNALLIEIYRGDMHGSELVIQADRIYEQLARSSINNAFPATIRPSLLPAFIRTADIKRVYRALWVCWQSAGASWKPRPNLEFDAAIVLERRDGALLTVIDSSLRGRAMPHDYLEIGEHIIDVEEQSDLLMQRVNSELGTSLEASGVEVFPGFYKSHVAGNQDVIIPVDQERVDLIKIVAAPGEFLLVTGTAKHFILRIPTVDPCSCHDWVFCQTIDQAKGIRPIFARSVEPKAFFVSREGHHCAHRIVHDRRTARCQIDGFEEFLCCRTCVLQSFCWRPQEIAGLPCGTENMAGATPYCSA
jgi:hypothetical protein